MGNIGSNLFATPKEKEIRKLTKKNTNVNRVSLHLANTFQSTPSKKNKRQNMQPLRFENMITEVTYDREHGEIDIVTRESLNSESEDALGNILDIVPTTVPVVPSITKDGDLGRRLGTKGLLHDSSFVMAHAPRRSLDQETIHTARPPTPPQNWAGRESSADVFPVRSTSDSSIGSVTAPPNSATGSFNMRNSVIAAGSD
jgi:hypothetical protein